MTKKKKPTNKQKDMLLQSRMKPKTGKKPLIMRNMLHPSVINQNVGLKEPIMRDMLPQYQMETKRRLDEARKQKEAFSNEILQISAHPYATDVSEDITKTTLEKLTKPITLPKL